MNKQGLLAGSSDTPLADEGIAQAHEAGKGAKSLHIDLIVTSTLQRASKTAEIVAQELGLPPEKIIVDPRAVERNFGSLEGTSWNPNLSFEGNDTVEPYEAILARAQSLKEFIDGRPEENILLVSHGSFIRAFRSLYDPNLPYVNGTSGTIPNGEIIKLL